MSSSLVLALLPLAAGAIASLLAEGAKSLPAVPAALKSTAVVRASVALLSLGASLAVAYWNGQLASFDFASASQVLIQAVEVYAAAVAVHDHVLAKAA